MLRPQHISGELEGSTFVSKVFYFAEIDSTNDFIKKNSLPDGSLVITENQTKGRGRFERVWYSAPGENLTFSILKNFNLLPEDQFMLNCCVSYSAFSSICNSIKNTGLMASIKWPNDIILNGKKIAGILIEKKSSSSNYVIGIGINVNQKKFGHEFLSQATSLFIETGEETDINVLLCSVIAELNTNFELLIKHKFDEIFSLWKSCNNFIGKEVVFVDQKSEVYSGILDEVLRSGQIVIADEGKKSVYSSGEITVKI